MRLELNPSEAQFLYDVLDKVNVSGVQAKSVLVGIMDKLVQAARPQSEPELSEVPKEKN